MSWFVSRCFSLCHVAVLVRGRLTPLDVLLVDEHLDALLDHADAGVEPGFGLVDDLWTQTQKPLFVYPLFVIDESK